MKTKDNFNRVTQAAAKLYPILIQEQNQRNQQSKARFVVSPGGKITKVY